jgi:glycosyltransferase involved in cell wall biosynthesis
MRILVLAPQPFMSQRGTPLATKMLLETLSRRGDRMDVMIFAEGEDIEIERCRFTRVPALPGLRNIQPGFSVKKLLCDCLMFPMVFWKLLRNRYDLIIAVEESAYFAMVLRPFFRVPYIFDVDSSIPEQISDKYDLPGWVQRILVSAERGAARNALGAITCCQALKDTVAAYAPDIPVQVLEDVTMLSDTDEEARPDDLDFDHPVIMYVGNLETYQGIDLLLEGFAGIDQAETPAHLVVIGGSSEHLEKYMAKTQKMGISDTVRFLGPRPVEKLGLYLRAAAITVSPRTQGRNTPMKVYSYLDSGRPLVATRLSTHTQVLDDSISMLVEPNAEDMAQGFTALLRDPDLRRRMGVAARDRVAKEFSPEAYDRKLTGFFETEIEPRLAAGKNEAAN